MTPSRETSTRTIATFQSRDASGLISVIEITEPVDGQIDICTYVVHGSAASAASAVYRYAQDAFAEAETRAGWPR